MGGDVVPQAGIEQLLNFLPGQRIRPAQHLGHECDTRKMLHHLHPEERLPDVTAIRYTTVVLHQQRVVVRNKRQHPVRKSRRTGQTVLGKGTAPK